MNLLLKDVIIFLNLQYDSTFRDLNSNQKEMIFNAIKDFTIGNMKKRIKNKNASKPKKIAFFNIELKNIILIKIFKIYLL